MQDLGRGGEPWGKKSWTSRDIERMTLASWLTGSQGVHASSRRRSSPFAEEAEAFGGNGHNQTYWFSTQDDFAPWGHRAIFRDI